MTRPALVVLVVLVMLGGWNLLHQAGTPAAGQSQPLRPRSQTSVLVLNGNGIAGAAGDVSNHLFSKGYRSADATDAQVTTYARSIVLYRPGWANEALRLAQDTHIRATAPLDGPLPAADGGSPLVLIVGH